MTKKPRKLDKHLINDLSRLLRQDCTMVEACLLLDISTASVYRWRKQGKRQIGGNCRTLHEVLTAIELEREEKKTERKRKILSYKIKKLQERYA